MLNITLSEFMVELKDGSIKNVGPTNKHADAKLFDVDDATAREFGDKRVKLVFEDDSGNEVQVALFPEQVAALADDIDALTADSPVFE
ncbi:MULTISPECIES: hypothetical protein [Halobacterium]|uniref:Uncharacterized protein n=5 Tax=Halobacterium salinarum TaxID=2242 RepID=A0A510N760_HALSA|nr:MULTISPECIES: hypothetical protein [Halobacterium]MBB6088810.1 hypothetical protein [Halobacterium salinarum]MCF2165319.1 hypothetical protein [Halobacterium salinarum]MCF2167872.1 hypothetical protein [Halobacterium salinarum]MCF2206290.1 hypothetical protein [Halobacterium salinarum]MCF2239427.1 hypothetical protein [Halobacterium salinarum]